METATNLIRALTSILNHNATNFSGVNRATLRQIEGTIQAAEAYLDENDAIDAAVEDNNDDSE